MRARRGLLFAGFTLFVVCATHRVGAAGPWEAEGGAYGGSAAGHMTCGPDMRIAYGGVGGEVRYSQARVPGESDGVAFDVGGVAETERAWAVGCTAGACNGDGFSGLAPSGRARLGYDWPGFGFRVGALLWTQPQTGQSLHVVPVPDLALRFGALDDITRQTLNEELMGLWTRRRWTGLFVTHNIAEAVFLSERILVMSARPGRIVADVRVPFAMPRTAELRSQAEFARLTGQVTAELRGADV